MPIRRFENPRSIIRAGYVAVGVAVVFTFVGRHWLPSVIPQDGFDAVAGLLHGVAFGLLGLGIWRFSRSRSHNGRHTSR